MTQDEADIIRVLKLYGFALNAHARERELPFEFADAGELGYSKALTGK